MYSENETICCDILPEISRIYEQRKFDESLCIFLSHLQFFSGDDRRRENSEDVIRINVAGIECHATMEKCLAVRQHRMTSEEQMIFGIFGVSGHDVVTSSEVPPEVVALNARLILPTSSIALRDFPIPTSSEASHLFTELQGLFLCSMDHLKVSQTSSDELFLHVDLKKEQQTSRSALFEAIWLMMEYLGRGEKKIDKIDKLVMPFVHFGRVRICLKIGESGILSVKIFNLFGSLFGVLEGVGGDVKLPSEDNCFLTEDVLNQQFEKCEGVQNSEDVILNILKNRMNIRIPEDVTTTPLPYLGIDSLRIAELEYYIATSSEFQRLQLRSPFLMQFKTIEEISKFLDALDDVNASEASEVSEDVKESTEDVKNFRIPLSYQQKRILFVSEMEESQKTSKITSQFAEPVLLQFSSDVDVPRLLTSLNLLILRHSILRARYFQDYQYLLSGTECFVGILEEDVKFSSEEGIEDVFSIKCILKSSRLLKIIFHHISIDGTSLSIFYKQFLEIYGRIEQIPPNHLQYHDYCSLTSSETPQKTSEFWRNYLEDVEIEELPTDYPRSSENLLIGARIQKTFPPTIQKKFDVICLENSLSKFELFFFLLENSLLTVLGVPVTMGFAVDQREFEFQKTMGCFTNVLPYISTSSESLKTCQSTLRILRSHGRLDFQKIAKIAGRSDLFQIFVVSDVTEVVTSSESPKRKKSVRFSDDVEDIQVLTPSEDVPTIAKYEMTWYLRENPGGLIIEVEYAKELFKKDTVECIMEQVFRQVNHYPKAIKSDVFKIRRSDFPSSTVSQIFQKSGTYLRYIGKDSKIQNSSQISTFLIRAHLQRYGQLLQEHPILLKLPRTPELVEMILAVWKAGFYPVPLNLGTTSEGVKKIQKTLKVSEDVIEEVRRCSEGRIFNRQNIYDIAYVTSTSGSTGTPKLVGTSFEGHSNLGVQYTKTFQLSSKDVICQTVDPSFDIFFADVTKSFCNGARLLLSEDQIPSHLELGECTNAYLMPALISRIPLKTLRNLESLQYGGEPLALQVIQNILEIEKEMRIWQEYGLTEQTVYSARQRMGKIRKDSEDVEDARRIGTPYDNIGIQIKERKSWKCLRGSLVLKGVGIMRGYFGSTTEVLREFPTGDDVFYDQKMVIFIGRRDGQVKVRGFRVDLFEIESIAMASGYCQMVTCVVTNRQELVLFYKGPKNWEKIKKSLEKELVGYKIPSRFIFLEDFPLTRTGKIDRKMLRSVAEQSEVSEDVRSALNPPNPPNNIINSLWKWLEHYSESKISSEDVNIFNSGVDSIAVMLTMQKMRLEGVNIPVKRFFELKTLRKIGEQGILVDKVEKEVEELQKTSKNLYINLNHIQQRILFLSRLTSSEKLFRMSFSLPLPENQENLGLATNTVIQGNPLLRATLKRVQGEHRFFLLSGTESFYSIQKRTSRRRDAFETEIWISTKDLEDSLKLSIHHLICDGRSLRILKNQLERLLNQESVTFERNFDVNNEGGLMEVQEFKSNFENFQFAVETSSKLIFDVSNFFGTSEYSEDVPRTHYITYLYCKSLLSTFQLPQFPVACTFANRNSQNFHTVSMFANTLPVIFTSSDTLKTFSEKIQKRNDDSNVTLNTKGSGGFADFAVNFHKDFENSNDSEDVCQFPMLLTYSEIDGMAVIEYDATVISRSQAEDVKRKILGVTEPRGMVEVFQKMLNLEDVTENSNFFHLGGHSLLAMKMMDMLSEELHVELPIKLIFDNPTPKMLELAVKTFKDGGKEVSFNPPLSFQFPLSSQQLQMYFLSEITSNSLEYQLPFIQPFPSFLSIGQIHLSLLCTIQQQSIFRTVFRSSEVPYQEVLSITECFISEFIIETKDEEDLHSEIKKLCDEPIEVLSGRPLIRAAFVVSDKKNVAFLHLHHLISDARSTQITNSTMRGFLEGKGVERMRINYVNYCREKEKEEEREMDENYLKSLLEGTKSIGKALKNAEKSQISIESSKIKGSGSPFFTFLTVITKVFVNFFKIPTLNIAFPTLNRTEKTSNICGYFLNNLLINSTQLTSLPQVLQWNYPYSTVIQEVRRRCGVETEVAEVYINCRYDLEYDESDDDVLLDLIPMKLHFPFEIDIDLLKDEFKLTMRSNRMNIEEIEDVLDKVKEEFHGKDEEDSIIYGKKKDYPSISLPELYQNLFSTTFGVFAPSLQYPQAFSILQSFSSQLFRQFLLEKGSPIRSDDIIGVISSKSPQTTLKCLAVQFLGASYLPIDVKYPEERKKEILEDVQLVFPQDLMEGDVRRRHFNCASSESLAYVITTSGTTGKPKSVAISGYSVANLCLSSTISMNVSSKSRIFQFTNFVFDNSVLEISMAISSGARLHYPNSEFFDPLELQNSEITHCLLFPSLVQSISISKLKNLAYWIVGGERLPQRLLEDALDIGCHVIQNYGPTETTAFAVVKRMRRGDLGQVIGIPAVNSKVKIENGQLWISGAGRMRGYLHFQNSQWYCSGDNCRITSDGLEFLGRSDSQVKIRGFRVELTEIEGIIEDLEWIGTCKAVFNEDLQQIHVFYTSYQLQKSKNSEEDVRNHCLKHLEPQKIPSTFHHLQEFPLTRNSKIDKEKLKGMTSSATSSGFSGSSGAVTSSTCSGVSGSSGALTSSTSSGTSSGSSSESLTSSTLSSIWKELLHCPTPSDTDHFFLIGGHSLLLIRLRHLIQSQLGIQLTIPVMLENLKFGDMRRYLEGVQKIQKTLIFFPALYGGCTAYLKLMSLLRSSFDIVLLDEEDGDTVDDVAWKYKKQIDGKVSPSSSKMFLGASSAGTFAHATSTLYSDVITVVLLDTGTFWELIEHLQYSQHEKEMLENLKIYEIDEQTSRQMAQNSWKTLQLLKNYKFLGKNHQKMHVLSVDGSDLGWNKYSNQLEIHKIPGDHYSMLYDDGNVQLIAEVVKKINKSINL